MKKTLTTLMVLAIAFTAVSATAGDVDWKFYGKLHSSINLLGNGENSQLGLTSNTSRFGFKGSAAMNDNFTFVWQFEQKLNIAQTGNEVLSNRNSYVGFKNADFGEVRMGIHDTPHKTLGRKTTFFFDTVGDNRTMTFGTDSRLTDILAWVSPNWSGFGLFLAYQFDQDGSKLTSDDPDAEFFSQTAFSGMATYAKDNFLVGASAIFFGEGYNATGGADRGDSPTVLRFAGKYNAEQFGLAASYLTVGGQDWNDVDAYVDMTAQTIGFEAIFHANEKYDVKAAYYMADPNTDMDDDDYGLLAFGIDRNFSKNLQMYVQYAMLSNGDASDATLGNNTPGGGTSGSNGFGKSVSGFANDDGTYANPYGFSWGLAYSW